VNDADAETAAATAVDFFFVFVEGTTREMERGTTDDDPHPPSIATTYFCGRPGGSGRLDVCKT